MLAVIIVLGVLGYILGGFLTNLISADGETVKGNEGWVIFTHVAWPLILFIAVVLYYPGKFITMFGKHYIRFLHEFGGQEKEKKPEEVEGQVLPKSWTERHPS